MKNPQKQKLSKQARTILMNEIEKFLSNKSHTEYDERYASIYRLNQMVLDEFIEHLNNQLQRCKP